MTNFISGITGLGNTFTNFGFFSNIVLGASGFIFLTVWGWLVLCVLFVLTVIYNSRDRQGNITILGVIGSLSDASFKFFSGITTVIICLTIVITAGLITKAVSGMEKTASLYHDAYKLDAALKNLKSERKLLEVNVEPAIYTNAKAMKVRIRYFSYSPVKDSDIFTGDASYMITGKILYINFGVFNFDYSLIENGTAKNIDFPSKIYSDSISFDEGIDINAGDSGVPLTFTLDTPDIFILDKVDYNDIMSRLTSAVTNSGQARTLGLRTSYQEAPAVQPDPSKTYVFYSTAAGGIVVK